MNTVTWGPVTVWTGQATRFIFPAWGITREQALREAFRKVRRDVWDARESRLRATWESYG